MAYGTIILIFNTIDWFETISIYRKLLQNGRKHCSFIFFIHREKHYIVNMGCCNFCYIVVIVICVCEINLSEALPQDFGRFFFNFGGNQQIPHRQGSIEEFLASRPSTPKPIYQKPCIPSQYYPRVNRSPIFNKKKFNPSYAVNIYEQNINNVVPVNSVKPIYNGYGGYYCGNHVPLQPEPVHQAVHNNFLSHFSNLFGGIFGINTNVISASPGESNVKPVHEDNHDIHPNGVSFYHQIEFTTIEDSFECSKIQCAASFFLSDRSMATRQTSRRNTKHSCWTSSRLL